MDKLAEIGEFLLQQGKSEFADHIAKMMLEQKQKEKELIDRGLGKGVRKISGWGDAPDYNSEDDHYDSEEDVDLSEEEGNVVPEDLEVKVDAEGFQSLA